MLNCSDATAAEIDQEVMKILKESYEEAKRLLAENREAMDKIAAFLIEKETITGKEFMEIFHQVEGITPGRRPGENGGADRHESGSGDRFRGRTVNRRKQVEDAAMLKFNVAALC